MRTPLPALHGPQSHGACVVKGTRIGCSDMILTHPLLKCQTMQPAIRKLLRIQICPCVGPTGSCGHQWVLAWWRDRLLYYPLRADFLLALELEEYRWDPIHIEPIR